MNYQDIKLTDKVINAINDFLFIPNDGSMDSAIFQIPGNILALGNLISMLQSLDFSGTERIIISGNTTPKYVKDEELLKIAIASYVANGPTYNADDITTKSEARIIFDHWPNANQFSDKIFLEEKSENTFDNFRFSEFAGLYKRTQNQELVICCPTCVALRTKLTAKSVLPWANIKTISYPASSEALNIHITPSQWPSSEFGRRVIFDEITSINNYRNQDLKLDPQTSEKLQSLLSLVGHKFEER